MTNSEQQNMDVMHRFFDEVWNKGREEAIDELYVPEGTAHGLGEKYKSGPEEFKLFHRLLCQTCSDIHAEMNDIMAAGDRVAIRGTITMKHNATGRDLRIEGGGFARINDGKIVEAWNGWDFVGVMVQLGALAEDSLDNAFLTGQAKAR